MIESVLIYTICAAVFTRLYVDVRFLVYGTPLKTQLSLSTTNSFKSKEDELAVSGSQNWMHQSVVLFRLRKYLTDLVQVYSLSI